MSVKLLSPCTLLRESLVMNILHKKMFPIFHFVKAGGGGATFQMLEICPKNSGINCMASLHK